MMTLSTQTQKNYQALIRNLYRGAVICSPDQITDEVAELINKILDEDLAATQASPETQELLDILTLSEPFAGFSQELVGTRLDPIYQWLSNTKKDAYTAQAIGNVASKWQWRLESWL